MGVPTNRTTGTRQLHKSKVRSSDQRRNAAARRSTKRTAERLVLAGGSRTARRKIGLALADKLERTFCSVELSRVVGRTIGETEKNLSRLLALAQAAGAVLLFDEAEALFGKRTGVKDRHDRYANQDVQHLLQRIDAYEGAVILATNKRANLDEAFLRRSGFATKSTS